MRYIIFLCFFALSATQVWADFTAHIIKRSSIYPIVSSEIKGDVFRAEMMEREIRSVAANVFKDSIPSSSIHGSFDNIYIQMRSFFGDDGSLKYTDMDIAIEFLASHHVSYVVFVTEQLKEGLFSVSTDGGPWLYQDTHLLSHREGVMSHDDSSRGAFSTITDPMYNLPHSVKNIHVDLRGVSPKRRTVSFRGSARVMTSGPIKIMCYDKNGEVVKDGLSRTEWLHPINYVGNDSYTPNNSFSYGYKTVSHPSVDKLSFIFDEQISIHADQPITAIPGATGDNGNTREIHAGFVIEEPTVIQFAAWCGDIHKPLVVMHGDERKVIKAIPHVKERGDGLTIFDIPFETAGLHKIIFAYPYGRVGTRDSLDIRLFIRRPGDSHLRPFTVQDSVIID